MVASGPSFCYDRYIRNKGHDEKEIDMAHYEVTQVRGDVNGNQTRTTAIVPEHHVAGVKADMRAAMRSNKDQGSDRIKVRKV